MNTKELDKQYKFCVDLIELKNNIEKNFLVLGKGLLKIRDERLYFPQWDSFEIYLEELKLDPTKAIKLINIYTTFVLQYEIPEEQILKAGGWTVANQIQAVTKRLKDGKEQSEKLLDLAGVLSQKDFEKELSTARNGLDELECIHDLYEVHLRCCRRCSLREKIYSEEMPQSDVQA